MLFLFCSSYNYNQCGHSFVYCMHLSQVSVKRMQWLAKEIWILLRFISYVFRDDGEVHENHKPLEDMVH